MYNNNQTTKELWAVIDDRGHVVYSRGGSSSQSKPMVYVSQKKAEAALSNRWTQQVHGELSLKVVKVYSVD